MKRKSSDSVSLVYAYGVGSVIAGLDHVYAEQARNRALWDRLVDIDHANEVAILAAASADDDRLVFLRDEIYHAGRALSDAIKTRAAERKRSRGNAAPEAMDEAVSAASTRHKVARREFWERLAVWRKANPAAMREFTSRRFASIKEARNTSGLFWGNYNRVIQSFDTARTLCRKTGRRLRYSDDERADGCLTVQIQRTGSGLGAAPHELSPGKFASLQLAPVPAAAYDVNVSRGLRSRLCQTTLSMRADLAGNNLEARVWLHRPLPENCRVKSAQLTWQDGGARGRRWQLALTISVPRRDGVHQHPSDAVGIDVGWRLKPDGSMRVAYWHGSDGESGELVLPAKWMQHMDHIECTQGEVDGDTIHGEKPVRYAQLRVKGGRAKDLGERREIYRLFARRIAMRYGVVGVEHLDLARMAFRGDNPEFAGRAQRQRAAVHTLLSEIRHQCAKHRAQHIPLDGPSTMLCHSCGRVGEPAGRARLIWTCDGCGSTYDQDANAAINLMHAAAQAASGHVVTNTEDKENKVLPAESKTRRRAARKLPPGQPGINEI